MLVAKSKGTWPYYYLGHESCPGKVENPARRDIKMMGIFEYILDCHPGEPNDSGNNMKQQMTTLMDHK